MRLETSQMPQYITRSTIRKLPGQVIKAVEIPEPTITEGFGAREKAGEICAQKGYRQVLLVTDKTLFSLGYHKKVQESIEARGISCTVFSDIASEPDTDIIKAGRQAALGCKAEAIVALGGGSVMDSSKMIAAGVRLKDLNEHFLLVKFLFVPHKTLPLINIPSTAGTGAEITVGAVITDTVLKTKGSTVIVGLDITDVILDSELTLKAPAKVTAACGIDALSHGLEGCVADIKTSEEDLEKSQECVRLVLENLPKVLANPEDIEARQAMCRAANYGGNAINKQLAGYVHAFAHTIGATYHIPHGSAIAASLMPVMERQKDKCTDKLSALAAYCGIEAPSDQEAADKLLEKIGTLIRESGALPQNLNIPEEDFHHLTVKICEDSINYSAPTTFTDKEIKEILWHIQNQK